MLNKPTIELENGFRDYYDNNLVSGVLYINKLRKKYLAILIGYILIFLSIVIYFAVKKAYMNIFVSIAAILFFFTTTYYIYIYLKNKLNGKNILLDQILKYFEGFTAVPEYTDIVSGKYYTINDRDIINSKLVEDYNVSHTDDEIYGSYKNVNLTISEKTLILKKRNADNRIEKRKIFEGFFVLMNMNKKFSGQTIIRRKRFFKNLEFNPFSKYGFEKVSLEDVEFKKLFEVLTTDQIEARYILTTAFIDRFKKLIKIFSTKKTGCSFYNNKILISVNMNRNTFECTNLLYPITYITAKKVFDEILSILKIIDILKLDNTLGL